MIKTTRVLHGTGTVNHLITHLVGSILLISFVSCVACSIALVFVSSFCVLCPWCLRFMIVGSWLPLQISLTFIYHPPVFRPINIDTLPSIMPLYYRVDINNVYFAINKLLCHRADIDNVYFTINKLLCYRAINTYLNSSMKLHHHDATRLLCHQTDINNVYFTINKAVFVIRLT